MAATSTTAAVTANLLATAPHQSLQQAVAFRPQLPPPPPTPGPAQSLQQSAVPSSAVLAATLRSAASGLPGGQMLTSPYITAAPLMRKMTPTSIPTTLSAASLTTAAHQKQLYSATGEDLMLEAAAVAAVNQNNNNADDG